MKNSKKLSEELSEIISKPASENHNHIVSYKNFVDDLYERLLTTRGGKMTPPVVKAKENKEKFEAILQGEYDTLIWNPELDLTITDKLVFILGEHPAYNIVSNFDNTEMLKSDTDIYDIMVTEDIHSPETSMISKFKIHFAENPSKNFKDMVEYLTEGSYYSTKAENMEDVKHLLKIIFDRFQVEEKYYDIIN